MVIINRDTCENWYRNNPVLLVDEIGYDTTHNRVKFGDGVHNWNDLPYIDTKFNAGEFRELLMNIMDTELPRKADKEEVYTKADIENRKFVSEKDLLAKNYMNKDEAKMEFLSNAHADDLVSRNEIMACNFADKSMLDSKADKSEVYTKTEIDRKLLNTCHHSYNHLRPSYNGGLEVGKPSTDKDHFEMVENGCVDVFESIYTKGEVDAFIEKKADKRFVNQALLLKADQSYVDGRLGSEFYTISEIDDIVKSFAGDDVSSFVRQDDLETLSNRLDDGYYTKVDVDNLVNTLTGADVSVFVTKEDISEVLDKTDEKADKETVDEALELKADKEEVYTKDEIDENIKQVSESIELKADKETVENLQIQVNTTYSREVIDNKVNDVKTTAIEAKQIANDVSQDVISNYVSNEALAVNIKHLEDEIGNVGKQLDNLIEVLKSKNIIGQGDLD